MSFSDSKLTACRIKYLLNEASQIWPNFPTNPKQLQYFLQSVLQSNFDVFPDSSLSSVLAIVNPKSTGNGDVITTTALVVKIQAETETGAATKKFIGLVRNLLRRKYAESDELRNLVVNVFKRRQDDRFHIDTVMECEL